MGHDLPSLAEAVFLSVHSCDPEKRPSVWENLVVTGGSSQIPGFKSRLRRELQVCFPFPETAGELQISTEPNFVAVPDYYTDNIKDYPDLTTYFGAVVSAKLIFTDPKMYITKAEYNEQGPAVCHLKSPLQ